MNQTLEIKKSRKSNIKKNKELNTGVTVHKKTFFSTVKANKELLLLTIPGTIWFLIFAYLPMFGVTIAFKDWKIHGSFFESWLKSDWVWLDNFKFLFKSSDAWLITRNTVLYNLVFIILGIVLPVTLAILLKEIFNKRLSKFYQTSMFIIIIMSQWKGVGYGTVVYLASICGIDKTYYEAALIDGATKWQQIKNITIPLLKPIIIIMFITSIGGMFRSDFGLFYQLPKNSGALYPVTNVIDTYVYRGLMNLGNVGMSSAAALYQSFVGMILIITTNAIVKKVDEESAFF